MFVHRGEPGAEEAVEGVLGGEAGGEEVGDAEDDFAVAEVEGKGDLAFAVVDAGQEFGEPGYQMGGDKNCPPWLHSPNPNRDFCLDRSWLLCHRRLRTSPAAQASRSTTTS